MINFVDLLWHSSPMMLLGDLKKAIRQCDKHFLVCPWGPKVPRYFCSNDCEGSSR